MINLFANIGVGHENDWECIKSRVVAAAQCNADAIVMTKSTPDLIIPKQKRYGSIYIYNKYGFFNQNLLCSILIIVSNSRW